MGLELPEGPLSAVGDFLGHLFPDGDVNGLVAMGGGHDRHADRLREHLADGTGSSEAVAATSRGAGVTAFVQNFHHPEGANRNIGDAVSGIRVAGLGLQVSAGIVLAHKGVTLLQYGLVAAALARAAVAGGAGAALVPGIQQAGRRALDKGTDAAVEAVLT
ncbi:hypothetical protein OHA77_28570 [Streptosporangium sp. NBC_01639]|uniref:hypothetical protein n=1 Tax=Streptosporangium sp. NBC_01639 TaxID=2975948 RepID=UPI003862EFCE|nr:hypothetical protein OHA77_28570 [Streptosporangium sp. NBC_01639]